MRNKLYIFTAFCFIIACDSPQKQEYEARGKELIEYSQNLSIEDFIDYYKVKVLDNSADDSVRFTYIFYKNDKPSIKADVFVSIPVSRTICLSTNHLPAFSALGGDEKIVGFPGTHYIYNEALLNRVEEGKLTDVGQKTGVNIELVMSLQPDILISYTMGSSFEQLKPLQKSGIPVVLNADYLENSPLGRAEWLKLTAVLLDQYQKGDSLFKNIEANYNASKDLVKEVTNRPTVLTGVMYGDVWYVPGGNSFAAKFINDAGGNYLWSDTQKTGSLALSFESVIEKAKDADLWIGAASFVTYEELKNNNSKYVLFDAFKSQSIYSYTKRVNKSKANDYLESGYMRPDLILNDYIKILHPELLSDEESTYFQPLKP